MPKFRVPDLPTWADPKNASVFDSTPIAALRKVVHWTGLDDPTSSVMQAAAPASPLISIYKDAAGVPSRSLREAGTEVFRKMARALPARLTTAADEFAERYPRIAAHIRPERGQPVGTASAATWAPTGQVTEPVKVSFTPRGQQATIGDKYPLAMDNAREFMNHEGTHVAQSLGNSDFLDLYHAANNAVGYTENPFEQTARYAGKLAGPLSGVDPARVPPPNNAIKGLKNLVETYETVPNSVSPAGVTLDPTKYHVEGIKETLKTRAKEGWNPDPDYIMDKPKIGELIKYKDPYSGSITRQRLHTQEHLDEVLARMKNKQIDILKHVK